MGPRGLFARVLLAGLILGALVVGMSLTLALATSSHRRSTASVEHSDRVLAAAAKIERGMVDVETGVRAFAATGDRALLAPSIAGEAALPQELAGLRRLVSDTPSQERRAAGLQGAIAAYIAGYARPLSARSGPLGRPALIASFDRGKRALDALRARFDRFEASELALRADRARQAAATESTLGVVRLTTTVAILLGLAGLLFYLVRAVIVPLRRAIDACARVAAGERRELLAVNDRTELGELARAFNAMVVRLAEGEEELRDAECRQAEASQRLELILANLQGSAVVLYDHELRLRFCEGALFANMDVDRMMGQPLPEFVSEKTFALIGPGVRGALKGEISSTALAADRNGRTLAVHFAPYQLRDGTIEGALVHWQDVSAVRDAHRERDEARERFELAFENAPIGMALLDLEGRFTQVNAALCAILGYAPEDLDGMRMLSFTHPDDVESDREAMDEMRAGTRTAYSAEKRYLHAAGHPLHCALQATLIAGEDGVPQRLLCQVQDITDRKRNEQQLEYLADHDALTGLLNRRAFARELGSHADRVARYGAEGTILMIDLDQFKFVNDTLGHQVGDELIVRVAHLLSERLRDTDVLARLGGDEFAVLLPKAEPADGALVAASVLETIRGEAIAGTERRVTASIGIASFEDAQGLSGDEVMVNADLAMYDAKENGRDRYAIFSSDQHAQARTKGRITWAQRITTALESDGFALLAQPIIDLATGHTRQYELLLRMEDEHGDLIPPSVFLYIAERLDLIQNIDTWVVTKGIGMLSALDPSDDISLEINLSGRSVGDPQLLEHIDTSLHNAHVAPERLIFEISETAALTNVTKARAFGERLSEIGCRFALDDFGAGFGSFYHLKHLVFDYLKIDGEFINECRSNPTDELVIKAIVDLAHGMGKQTIAEFVSDDETVELLVRLGVDYGQGYHLGRPAPLEQQLALVSSRASRR